MIGRISEFVELLGGLAILSVKSLAALFRPRYEIRLWLVQMEHLGVKSLVVGSITTFFTGMVLALQTAYSLPELGVKFYMGSVVSKTLTRELGPVTATIVGSTILSLISKPVDGLPSTTAFTGSSTRTFSSS